MDIEKEKVYIEHQRLVFKTIFGEQSLKDDTLFLQYLSEHTNRQLMFELAALNKNFKELKESGFFDRDNGS